jgi:hypothetical protein
MGHVLTVGCAQIDLHLPSGEVSTGDDGMLWQEEEELSPWAISKPGRFGLSGHIEYGVDSSEEEELLEGDEAGGGCQGQEEAHPPMTSGGDIAKVVTHMRGIASWRARAFVKVTSNKREAIRQAELRKQDSTAARWRRAIGAVAPETFAKLNDVGWWSTSAGEQLLDSYNCGGGGGGGGGGVGWRGALHLLILTDRATMGVVVAMTRKLQPALAHLKRYARQMLQEISGELWDTLQADDLTVQDFDPMLLRMQKSTQMLKQSGQEMVRNAPSSPPPH